MTETLLKGATAILSMAEGCSEEGGDILLRDGAIAAIGNGLETDGEVVHVEGCVITPGLVNTHHHLYQTLTRAVQKIFNHPQLCKGVMICQGMPTLQPPLCQ